jgi:hypothetical protein
MLTSTIYPKPTPLRATTASLVFRKLGIYRLRIVRNLPKFRLDHPVPGCLHVREYINGTFNIVPTSEIQTVISTSPTIRSLLHQMQYTGVRDTDHGRTGQAAGPPKYARRVTYLKLGTNTNDRISFLDLNELEN